MLHLHVKALKLMDDDRTLQSGLSQDSIASGQSMSLYDNTRTNKCQYSNGPEINDCASEPQDRTSSDTEPNTISTQSKYHTAADALAVLDGPKYGSQKERASEIMKKAPDAEFYQGRNDSSIKIPGGSKITPNVTENRITLPTHAYFDSLSTNKDKRTIIYLKDHAALFIDLRGKRDIASLSSFLSVRELPPRSVRKVQITHYVIECAYVEGFAVPTPATTTIYFHDGSISVYSSFAPVYDSTCICDVERSTESLFRLEHKASGNHGVRTQNSNIVQMSITGLLGNFVNLLQPQLGSDPDELSTSYGLEVLECSMYRGETFDPTVHATCPKRSFHMSGWMDGVEVELSGFGRSDVL